MSTKVLRCAIYTRVSSDAGLEQEFNSLDAQREAAEAYIKSQTNEGWRLLRERFDDGGFSGANLDRPAIKRLLTDIEGGRVDVVVFYKIDRLSRKGAADVLRIADKAERHGWRLVVADVAMDTGTTVGRLVLTILSGVAEMESRRRSERMSDYHAARRARGEIAGVHYGMRNAAEAATVDRVLALWLAGESYAATARLMAEETGRAWCATQVRRIVRAHAAQPLTIAA